MFLIRSSIILRKQGIQLFFRALLYNCIYNVLVENKMILCIINQEHLRILPFIIIIIITLQMELRKAATVIMVPRKRLVRFVED